MTADIDTYLRSVHPLFYSGRTMFVKILSFFLGLIKYLNGPFFRFDLYKLISKKT